MNKHAALAAAMILALASSGCSMLEPKLPEEQAGIPAQWPLPPGGAPAAAPAAAGVTADIGWRDFFVDPKLEELIAHSLVNNRDLRVAVFNVERARQQYRIERADRVPSIEATGSLTRSGGSAGTTELYRADLVSTQFELDLFGRVRNLSEAALQQYFAADEARRSAQLSLVAEVANAYLTLAADREQAQLAEETLKTRNEAYGLTEKRHQLGAVSALDVYQSRTQVESARADAARLAGQVVRDLNALNLLVGEAVPPDLQPTSFDEQVTGLDPLPPGLPSQVLLRRPDVLQAEHTLRAANANIGAARAAFFPKITLTGAVGTASTELSGLFDAGTDTWSFIPQVSVPIFEGGRLRANLGVAHADRDIALAQYEKSIQQGFRETSDALALVTTLAAQRDALQSTVDAAKQATELSRARYAAGRDSYLALLDAQRTEYLARQALIVTRLAEQTNRVTLYKVLGGGWHEHSP